MERITNKVVSVGTSQVVVCSEVLPTQRKSIIIQNTSTGGQKITLAINQDAVSGAGFVMSPGGYYSDSINGNWFPVPFQFVVVSDLAGGTVTVLEVIGDVVEAKRW